MFSKDEPSFFFSFLLSAKQQVCGLWLVMFIPHSIKIFLSSRHHAKGSESHVQLYINYTSSYFRGSKFFLQFWRYVITDYSLGLYIYIQASEKSNPSAAHKMEENIYTIYMAARRNYIGTNLTRSMFSPTSNKVSTRWNKASLNQTLKWYKYYVHQEVQSQKTYLQLTRSFFDGSLLL